jgi:hypothetical protein
MGHRLTFLVMPVMCRINEEEATRFDRWDDNYYQRLICHEKRYFSLHACIPKVLPFFDVEHFDQRTRAAFF